MSNVTSGTALPIGQLTASDKVVSLSGFSGIDRRTSPGDTPIASKPSPAENLQNFRVLPGGALKKRCGFRRLATLPSDIRAACSMDFDGQERLFCATAEGVYLFSGETGFTRIGSIASAESSLIRFYTDHKGLCLFAGGQVFRVTETEIRDIAYIPTYIKDVPVGESAAALKYRYESCNLLSRRIRLVYIGNDADSLGQTHILLPFRVDSVESVTIPTKSYPTTYYLDNDTAYTRITLLTAPDPGEQVEIICQAPDSVFGTDDHPLASVRDAFLMGKVGSFNCYRLLLAAKTRGIRWSMPLPETDEDSVYIPASNYYDPASDGYPINGFCRHQDRVLCFSRTATYQILGLSPNTKFGLCNSSIGCDFPSALTTAENAPAFLSDGNLYTYVVTEEAVDPYREAILSEAIGTLHPTGRAILHFDRRRHELWIRDPSDETGTVHIYNTRTKAWYDFAGIPAEGFFCFSDKVGYFAGKNLFLSDETLTCDQSAAGTDVPIRALLETPWLGFDTGSPIRRSGTVSVACFTGNTALCVSAETDAGVITETTLSGKTPPASDVPSQIECGLTPGRFRFLKLRITSDGAERVGIYRLGILARK